MTQEKLTVPGTVKDGGVMPESALPLPDGTHMDIVFPPVMTDIPPKLQAEFEMWERASDEDFTRWIQKVEG